MLRQIAPEELNDEDRAAATRLADHLAAVGTETCGVIVTRLGASYVARAYAIDHIGSRKVESIATAATPAEALCEAARQIGVAL